MKTYKSTSDAAEAGYDIAPGRSGSIVVGGVELTVKDISGPNSFGYTYAALLAGRKIAETHTVWVEGTGRQAGKDVWVCRFRSDEIRASMG